LKNRDIAGKETDVSQANPDARAQSQLWRCQWNADDRIPKENH
jgi:hypothetical protein